MTPRKQEAIHVPEVRFIAEQDGIPEREFKKRICDYLSERNVKCRAYLVRVKYPTEDDWSVALCFGGTLPQWNEIEKGVGVAFSEMFRTDEHLDIFLLSKLQEEEASRIAKPFYPEDLATATKG